MPTLPRCVDAATMAGSRPLPAPEIKARPGPRLPDSSAQPPGAHRFAELAAQSCRRRIRITAFLPDQWGSNQQTHKELLSSSQEFTVRSTAAPAIRQRAGATS